MSDFNISDGITFTTTGRAYTPSPRVEVARIMAGFVGQIYINDQIVWESKPYKTYEKARKRAEAHRLSRLIEQFS